MEQHRGDYAGFRTGDMPTRDFLRDMVALNDTIIVFMSDHGPGVGFPRLTPFLRMIIPQGIRSFCYIYFGIYIYRLQAILLLELRKISSIISCVYLAVSICMKLSNTLLWV